MFIKLLFLVSVVCAGLALSADDYAATLAKALRERDFSAPGRELKAATNTKRLGKRHNRFFTATQLELTYTERENLDNEPNFGATIHCNSSVPVLLLEDFEHLTDSIVCQPGHVTINVAPGVETVAARSTLLGLEWGGLIITSHYGCNTHGERSLFRVGRVKMGEKGSVFVIDTTHASWKSSFKSLDVKMYHTSESHALRPHANLRRRQDPESTRTSINNMPTYAVPVPTATSTADKSTLDLNHSLINETILNLKNSTIELSCRNCSTFGSLDFSLISFRTRNVSDITERLTDDPMELGDVFEGGEFEIVANGMGARVELLTNISGNEVLSVPLFTIPLMFGISIPGIGSAGLLYAPALNVEYKVNGSVAFTYGFETGIPDGSKLYLDMTEPNNSTVAGFQDTSITAIPFQASVDMNNAVIDVFLRHQVQVGFFFALDIAELGVGVYLDLPKYRADFERLRDVDENCASLATSQSEDKEVAQSVLTDVYQIQTSANWQVGIAGKATAVEVLKGSFDLPLANGTFASVESSCLNFNKTAGTYVEAKEVVAEAKKNGAAGLSVATFATCWIALLGFAVSLLA